MKTWAPSSAKRLAAARPIPALPPVTSAIFPSSFLAMTFSCRITAAKPPGPQNLIHPSDGGYGLAQIVFIHKTYVWQIRCPCFELPNFGDSAGLHPVGE